MSELRQALDCYQSMIITNNEKALRVKTSDVSAEEAAAIIEQLERELEYSGRLGRFGIGLAAPQIGIAKNVAVVRINNLYKVNLVNAKIQNAYDLSHFKDEGCLSFPGRVEDTMRYQETYIVNNLVYPNSFIATGLMSVVIQHELDHLNSTLLPDKAIVKSKQRKPKPNDPCVCGKINPLTGKIKKYKKCCGVL